MVNRKGWLRIVEATVAILIVFSVILSLATTRKGVVETELSDNINPFLEEIAKNNTMRDIIIGDPVSAEMMIRDFVSRRIRQTNVGYDARVCDIDRVCGIDYPEGIVGNIYAGSRLISSSLVAGTESKKVTIFLWFKER